MQFRPYAVKLREHFFAASNKWPKLMSRDQSCSLFSQQQTLLLLLLWFGLNETSYCCGLQEADINLNHTKLDQNHTFFLR